MTERLHTQVSEHVRIVTRGEYDIVVQNFGSGRWTDARVFHRMSDDYAWTNARELAYNLAKLTGAGHD